MEKPRALCIESVSLTTVLSVFRRVPPAHYQKLRQVLTEMDEQGIIRKSMNEYASPLVMVWKKNGDLRICTDFRWLNRRTIRDAHPLPHQSDCLAALGGNAVFSTMDLTSGFYNLSLHEEDKKYTAFTTPLGLPEYNRMPQGLCNSLASFMRMTKLQQSLVLLRLPLDFCPQ